MFGLCSLVSKVKIRDFEQANTILDKMRLALEATNVEEVIIRNVKDTVEVFMWVHVLKKAELKITFMQGEDSSSHSARQGSEDDSRL